VQEKSSNELPLDFGEFSMRRQSVFHVIGACLECRQQVAMAPFKILKNTRQFVGGRFLVQPQDTIDDMIRPRLLARVEIPWFGRRPERAHDYPGWIRAQPESLPVQKWHLRQWGLESVEWRIRGNAAQ
jgi:hypothetical protein